MNTRQKIIRTVALCLGAFALLAGAGVRADVVYSLNQLNTTGYTGPYGSVNVALTGTGIGTSTATITFTYAQNGGNTYLFGDSGAVDMNVNGNFSVVTMTATSLNSTFLTPTLANGGSGNTSSWGVFNLSINNVAPPNGANGAKGAAATETIKLTGGTWSTAANVLIANVKGYAVAAHTFVFAGLNPSGKDQTLYTGFSTTGGAAVPIPAALLFVGPALIGLGFIGRKKRGAVELSAMAA